MIKNAEYIQAASLGRNRAVFCRASRAGTDGIQRAVLAVLPAAEHPTRDSFDRLTQEYELKDYLDGV